MAEKLVTKLPLKNKVIKERGGAGFVREGIIKSSSFSQATAEW